MAAYLTARFTAHSGAISPPLLFFIRVSIKIHRYKDTKIKGYN
jgi:hypothetical protein